MKAMQFPFFSPGFQPAVEQVGSRERASRRPPTRTSTGSLDSARPGPSTFDGPGVSLATGVLLSGLVSAGIWLSVGWAVWSLAN